MADSRRGRKPIFFKIYCLSRSQERQATYGGDPCWGDAQEERFCQSQQCQGLFTSFKGSVNLSRVKVCSPTIEGTVNWVNVCSPLVEVLSISAVSRYIFSWSMDCIQLELRFYQPQQCTH